MSRYERKDMQQIILASGSKNRQALFHALDLPFSVIPSTANEKSVKVTNPIRKVRAISKLKADEVASRTEGIVVAADTFTTIGDKHYEKPSDIEEAREMLREMSGQRGISVYGVCIINTEQNTRRLAHRVVNIEVQELTDPVIEEYLSSRPVTEWAAAYNPLDDRSASIFRTKHPLKPGYAHGIPGDILAEELKKAGIEIDLDRLIPKRLRSI